MFFHNDALDIEFGITKKLQVIIFQVRPITFMHSIDNSDKQVSKLIFHNQNNFKKYYKSSKLLGLKTIFSDMADWNPAEIIGHSPHPTRLLVILIFDFKL